MRGSRTDNRYGDLPDAEHDRVDRLMAENYRIDNILILPIYKLVMRLRGKPVGRESGAYLAITPT